MGDWSAISHVHGEQWADSSNALAVRRFRRRRRCSQVAYHRDMDLEFTAVYQRVPEGYIGFVEELPGANTQGATLEEVRANLLEAVGLVLQANRELIAETSGADVIREPLKVSA